MSVHAEATAEALLLASEDMLAEARRRGERIGLPAHASGIAVLQHAYGMALADCAGPGATVGEVARVVGHSVSTLIEVAHLHHSGRGRA